MSEVDGPKTAVCLNFEPQAWRKTVCRNCFKPPNLHTAECFQNGVDTDKKGRSGSVDKAENIAASSLRNKFEQLEQDKYKPSSPHTLPRTKKSSGLSMITGKYDEMDRKAGKLDSPTKSIPPPTAPKTYKKSKENAGLMKSKFGSVENVSMAITTGDNKLGSNFKYGSMENIAVGHDKKKDHVLLPAQQSKLNESVKNISVSDKKQIADSQSKHKTNVLLNKLDMFQNEIKAGATSKSGQTVIHKQTDGHVDIISLPNKKNESVEKYKKHTNQKKDTVGKVGDKAETKTKFQKPELKPAQKDSKDTQSGSSKLGLKSKFELRSQTDKGKQQDFKQGKNSLISSKVSATNSLERKTALEAKSDDKAAKTDLRKPGLKSVQKDTEQNKSAFLNNRLNKTEEKPNSKFENKNKPQTLNDNSKEVSRNFELNLKDKSHSEDIKKPKLSFKDQLKSPDPENSPFSAFKDKLKSPTAEPNNKLAPSWKDKLKSPTTDTENKLDLKLKTQLKPLSPGRDKEQELQINALKSPTPEETKNPESKLINQLKSPPPEASTKPEFKLRDQLKSPTPDENIKTEHKLRDQLKSPTPEENKMTEIKLRDQLKSPTPDENKKTELNLRDQLKSPTLDENKKTEHNLRDQLKSPTPDENKKTELKLRDQLKSPTPDENKKTEHNLRDQLKSPTPDENKKTEHNLRDQLKSPTPDENKKTELKLRDQLKSPTPDENKKTEHNLRDQLKSPTPDENKKTEHNLRDQLKSPTPDENKKTEHNLRDQLKSPTPDENKKTELKLRDQLKSPTPDENKKTEHNLRDQLKSPTPDENKKTELKLRDQLKSPTPEENKEKEFNCRDQLKSPTPDDNKEKEFNCRDQLKSPTPEENKKPEFSLRDQLKSPTPEGNKKPEFSLRDQLKSPTPEENKKPEFSLRDQLKSPTPDENKLTELKLRDQLKSPTPEENKNPEFNLRDQLKSPAPEESKKMEHMLGDQLTSENDKEQLKLKTQPKSPPASDTDKEHGVKMKAHLKFPVPEESKKPESKLKDQLKSTTQKTPMCQTKYGIQSTSPEKKVSNDLNSKFEKSGLKFSKTDEIDSSKTKNKPLDFRSGLKKSNDTLSRDKEPVSKFDTKNKYELPSLKSNKPNSVSEKSQDNKPKSGANDVRGSEKITNKVEPKFKLNKTDSKSISKDEKDTPLSKTKFELPKLKSSKPDKSEDSRSSIKSKYESTSQLSETKSEPKSKFQVPNLKKIKSPEPEKLDVQVDEKSIGKDIATHKDESRTVSDQMSRPVIENDNKDKVSDIELSAKDTDDICQKEKEESCKLESAEENNSKNNIPNASDISKTHIDNISPGIVSGDACADESMRDKQSLHVDTQVFTSSRSKTAGVSCLDDNHIDSADNASGFSSLEFRKSPSKDERSDKDTILNGDIALDVDERPAPKEALDNVTPVNDKYTESAFEQLKAELLNMTERCENLEKENEMLMGDISNKGAVESSLIKQREDVENAILRLRDQLNSMEDKCTYLESENINLMNDLKAKHDANNTKLNTKEADEIDERLISKEKLMEDMMDENEQLKQDINELKVEMEEMYDSFRDQEAEEFREIQKELEYTAKNCRILQFKLRKMERRNEQNEQDKNQFEDRLRKLQNSFQDRDAVSHIHSLEDELRMAKDVSVRLHDELDLMEDRRGKVEDENRHITELLEQADRKQFRLELEVDKLRDKVIELRQELRAREGGPEGEEPRKLNCAEFLALHRGTI